jgi:GNAT superfamily N-acetyltransferase
MLLGFAEAMHAASPRYRRLKFSPEKMEQTLRFLLDDGVGFLRVAVADGIGCIGVMAGMLSEHWMSADSIATDLALFVMPGARGMGAADALVQEFKTWANGRGAVWPQVGVSAGIADAEAVRLYERNGFKQCGVLLEAT